MNEEQIARYLQEHNIAVNARVSLLGSGESNINYLAESEGKKLIVRLSRADVSTAPRFDTEHHYLLFMEALGIPFAPRSLFYDPEQHVHITSFAPGKDASVIDLNDAQLKIFVDQVKRLNEVTYEQYRQWCKENGLEPREVLAGEERIKVNITERFNNIKAADDDFSRQVVDWAEPKTDRLLKLAAAIPKRVTFVHDDLRWNEGGGNLRVDGDTIVFIDWELTCFINDGMPEIADVMGSVPESPTARPLLKKLHELYLAAEENPAEDQAIEYGILWGKLGNPLWAAERYCFMVASGQPGIERYQKLTEQGMADAEPFFAAEFKDWF